MMSVGFVSFMDVILFGGVVSLRPRRFNVRTRRAAGIIVTPHRPDLAFGEREIGAARGSHAHRR